MNKEKLKRDLIKYIRYLTDTEENLEEKSYEDLYSMYVEVLGLDPVGMAAIISETISKYHVDNPDEVIDDEQIIDDIGILEPINYLHLMKNKLEELKSELEVTKSHLEMYSGFLEDDEKVDLNDVSLRSDQKTDLLNDLSYERQVVNKYPLRISELEYKIKRLEYAISKMNVYNMDLDSDGRRF